MTGSEAIQHPIRTEQLLEEDKAARPDGMFDEDLPEEGDTFAVTFDEPGTYAYYCDVHASMTGRITVE